ncbi:MAG: hypothetical protein ABIN89_01205 [Chitinophagaceae bacterium]
MRKVIYFFFVITSILSACNDSQDQKAGNNEQEEDSVLADKPDSVIMDANLAIINSTGFSKYARTSMPELNWNKFTITKFWQEDFPNKTNFEPGKDFWDTYGQFLKYSPDSSKFIDLDSYNISITKNKKGQLIGGSQEPDTEISLIDLKKKEKMRLVFLGPGNSVEDAAWIDNDNLVLIGYLENEAASGNIAAIWQFNLSSKRVNLYELSDEEVIKKLKNYSERERLKNVMIK